jgi:hypothetical protein
MAGPRAARAASPSLGIVEAEMGVSTVSVPTRSETALTLKWASGRHGAVSRTLTSSADAPSDIDARLRKERL